MSIGRVPGITGIQPSIVDAKGDLIVATAADSVDRLAVGSNGQILAADSSTATGLKWIAGGKVLQVVMGTTATQATNATTTYADTGLSASITPSATSSKVLVLVNQTSVRKSNGNLDNAANIKLLRGSTDIITFAISTGFTQTAIFNNVGTVTTMYLDSPNTTSSTTYKTQFANQVAQSLVSVQTDSNTTSTIILMEIGA